MTEISHPYGLPSEECVILVCSYIESLLVASQTATSPPKRANTPQPQSSPPTPPDDAQPPRPPRRSLDYVAERPNGILIPVLGEEYGIRFKYDDLDLDRQRESLALRFKSKSVPKISIFDYLERYVVFAK